MLISSKKEVVPQDWNIIGASINPGHSTLIVDLGRHFVYDIPDTKYHLS